MVKPVTITSVKVFISLQALGRVRKSTFISQSQNKKWYTRVISSLIASQLAYPSEKIGPFFVSPRGHEKRRVAWHFALESTIMHLFIDDLLYHISNSKYVDD